MEGAEELGDGDSLVRDNNPPPLLVHDADEANKTARAQQMRGLKRRRQKFSHVIQQSMDDDNGNTQQSNSKGEKGDEDGTNGRANNQTNKWKNKQMDERMNEWTNKQTN